MTLPDPQWAQLRPGDKRLSWHLVKTFTRMPGVALSVCNRNLDERTLRDTRPAGARSCETCLRKYVGDTGPVVAPV